MKQPPSSLPLRITQFAMIDTAMLRAIRAAARYERALYSVGERDALDKLIKAAIGLKETFVEVARQVNEQYAQEVERKEQDKDKE